MYDQEELKKIPGIKIRRQYVRGLLYFGIMICGAGLLNICLYGSRTIEHLKYVLLLPLVILPILPPVLLNRFLLGEIVCVINEDGIYYYHGFIEWKAIERVEFDIESRGRAPTVTSIYVMGKKRESKIVYNVPYFALRKIKKFKPDVELGFTDRGKRNLILYIVLAISLGVVLPLILFFLTL